MVALELREADARGELATFCCVHRKAEETCLPRKRSTGKEMRPRSRTVAVQGPDNVLVSGF